MYINISKEIKKNNLTDDEYKYLLLLEFHKDFNKTIKYARTQFFNWPESSNQRIDGLVITTSRKPKHYPESLPDPSQLMQATEYVVNKLGIPRTLSIWIEELLQTGLINSNSQSKIFVYGYSSTYRRNLLRHFHQPSLKYPQIIIYKSMGKDEFIETVKNHWFQIQQAMKELEAQNKIPILIQKKHIETLELDIKIYRHWKKKLSYSKIVDLIKLEGVDDLYCRKRVSEMNKLLRSIKFI